MELILAPNEILNQQCETVERDIKLIREQAIGMFKIMYDNNCVGLAAPQIGLLNQVIVMDTTQVDSVNGWKGLIINPVIMRRLNLKRETTEGCASFPNRLIKIKRAIEVSIKFKNTANKMEFKVFKGITATCFLHEWDHLQGIVFTKYEGLND